MRERQGLEPILCACPCPPCTTVVPKTPGLTLPRPRLQPMMKQHWQEHHARQFSHKLFVQMGRMRICHVKQTFLRGRRDNATTQLAKLLRRDTAGHQLTTMQWPRLIASGPNAMPGTPAWRHQCRNHGAANADEYSTQLGASNTPVQRRPNPGVLRKAAPT